FVGREHEMAEVGRLLRTTRLLTLTGPGGIGKTRLALEAAVRQTDSFPDGATLAELASVTDPRLVPHAVREAVGVGEQPRQSVVDLLVDYVGERRLLLILDNCEHVVAACAELANVLIHACPSLVILATSRERMGVAGETSWRVPPLSLPHASAIFAE